MKFRYTGDLDEITIRHVTFPKSKAVEVDCADLAAKLSVIPGFAEVKTRGKKQD